MRKRVLFRGRVECGLSRFQSDCEGTRNLTAAVLFRRNRATVFDFGRSEPVREIPPFNLLPSPRRFAEKCQAGFDAGVKLKAANGDSLGHGFPPVSHDQLRDDLFEGDPV